MFGDHKGGGELAEAHRPAAPRAASDKPRKKKNPQQVSLAGRIHKWAGLTIGVILLMCGLTGSYLAFYPEIERAAIAPLRQSAGQQPASYEAVYQALSQVGSPAEGRWNIELPGDGGVITSRYGRRGSPNRMVSLDPVTLDVVRDVEWGSTVSTWVYELHYRLLLGRSGATLMGVLALASMTMLIAGIVLWWRSGRTAAARMKYHVNGTAERKIYDVHRLSGVIGSAFLLIILATAAAMSLPDQVKPVLSAFSPIVKSPDPESAPANGRARIPLDQALAVVRAEMPGVDIRWVQVPTEETASYAIRFRDPGEPNRRFPKSYIWLDQYSGAVLAVRRETQGTASDRILGWFYPLHSGQAFGIWGRAIVALIGLFPLLLFVTGIIRWRGKASRLAAYKRSTAAAAARRNTHL